jgi:hypothetical protein
VSSDWDPFKTVFSENSGSSAFEPVGLDCMENRVRNFYDSHDNRSDWGGAPQNWAYSTSLGGDNNSFQSYGFSHQTSGNNNTSWGSTSWGWDSHSSWGSSGSQNSSWAFSPVTGNNNDTFNPFVPAPQAPKTMFPSSDITPQDSPFKPIGYEIPDFGKLKR